MEDDKKLQEEFIQFLAQQLGAKTEQDLTQKVKKLGKEGVKKYYDAFVQYKQKQAKKAAHGTKLTYFKHLKNQCPEGEEVVYYKVGGRVGCGCQKVKKAEDGVEFSNPVKPNKNSNKSNLKKKYINPDDTVHLKKIGIRDLTPTGKTGYKKLLPSEYRKASEEDKQKIDDKDAKRGRQIFEKGSKIKKNCGGVKLAKKGEKVCPKCGKVHSAGMGCAVAKFKKHYQGGSLNEIPFMQKAGKLIDPRAEEVKARAQRNAQNRADAKGMFKGMISGQIVPTLPNLGRMIGSAYKGWIDPEVSPYLNTGVAPIAGRAKSVGEILQRRADWLNSLKTMRSSGVTWEEIGPKWQSFWNKYGREPW